MGKKQKLERAREPAEALSIGALSRATRIPVETLRTWERRYGSPMPVRRPSGHRTYPTASVDHLRRVGRLLARGHRAGEVLRLTSRQLDALLAISDPAETRKVRESEPAGAGDQPLTFSIESALRAAVDLDRPSLLDELRAHWIRLGPLRFLEDFAGPFMVAIGSGWERKTFEIRHEHFASACLSDLLREVREPYHRAARGSRVAAATLPNDDHEGGLLMVSALLAYRGYRVLYLGANLPIAQIAAAATTGSVDIVALSISSAVPRKRSAGLVARLRTMLPRRMPLWVGGAGTPAGVPGVEPFGSLDALDAKLDAMT